MSTYSKQLLSASTNGEPIAITATATLGTLVHQSLLTGAVDEVWLWLVNRSALAVTVTVEWGAAGAAYHLVEGYSIPANSIPIEVSAGQVIQAGLQVTVFASTASAINAIGFVNRITG